MHCASGRPSSPLRAIPAEDLIRGGGIPPAERIQDSVAWVVRCPVRIVGDRRSRTALHAGGPPSGWTHAEPVAGLAGPVWQRARVFSPTFLATFPAFGGSPVVIIGRAQTTGKRSTAWVLTVLHEHFHQLQMSRAGYFAAVNALDLAAGDTTGMWMLNYPFPYDSAPVARAMTAVAQELAETVEHPSAARRDAFWQNYRAFQQPRRA
jgi:hypothetical protein